MYHSPTPFTTSMSLILKVLGTAPPRSLSESRCPGPAPLKQSCLLHFNMIPQATCMCIKDSGVVHSKLHWKGGCYTTCGNKSEKIISEKLHCERVKISRTHKWFIIGFCMYDWNSQNSISKPCLPPCFSPSQLSLEITSTSPMLSSP